MSLEHHQPSSWLVVTEKKVSLPHALPTQYHSAPIIKTWCFYLIRWASAGEKGERWENNSLLNGHYSSTGSVRLFSFSLDYPHLTINSFLEIFCSFFNSFLVYGKNFFYIFLTAEIVKRNFQNKTFVFNFHLIKVEMIFLVEIHWLQLISFCNESNFKVSFFWL